MVAKEGAGSGNPDKSGSGAPEGGSPEGGSENDDKPITAKQLKAILASQKAKFTEQLDAKDRELQAFKEGVGKRDEPKDQPKVYTKTELKAGVDAGQITQEQADDIWDRQRETQIRESARREALDAVTEHATKERIDADLKSYKRLKPEILDKSSETRQQIEEEFKALRSSGLPNDLRTELAAIRAVVGPLNKLEQAAKATRAPESEEQGGGSGDGGKPKPGAGKKLVDHLKGDAKEYYERGIKQGRYKDWDAVEAELKYARPSVRQRLGLPAA
jgi:hypothetical protein